MIGGIHPGGQQCKQLTILGVERANGAQPITRFDRLVSVNGEKVLWGKWKYIAEGYWIGMRRQS